MSIVVVQRGHVARTTGRTGAPGEQGFAIATADRIAHHVRRLGHQVRIIDADPSSESQYRGDFFVAVHYDSSDNPGARGASVGYQSPEGREFAENWKRHYVQNGWSSGWHPDNYTVNLGGYYGVKHAIKQGNRRAMIVEAGFHSSPIDAALLEGFNGPDRVAMAVAGALIDQLGCRCPNPATAAPVLPVTRGVRTSELQMLLGVHPDGIIGPKTEAAMWKWRIAWRQDAPGNHDASLVSWLQTQGNRLGYPCAIDGQVGPQVNHLIVVLLGQEDGVCGPVGYMEALK